MKIRNINAEQFQQLRSAGEAVLVDFWAPWCGYCRRISGAYDQVAQHNEGSLMVAKVNIDQEPRLAEAEGIDVIPTLVLYQGGRALGSIVAPASKAAIDAFIQNTLGTR